MREPSWVDERLALAIHERLLILHGGGNGLRDHGLLRSALARPQQNFAYDETADIVQLAAIYTAAIVQNHPFVDGNKRTGFVVGVLFLELNGLRFTALEEEAAQAVIALAAGQLSAKEFAAFVRANIMCL